MKRLLLMTILTVSSGLNMVSSANDIMRMSPQDVAAGNDAEYITVLLRYYLGILPNSAITQAFVKLSNQATYDALVECTQQGYVSNPLLQRAGFQQWCDTSPMIASLEQTIARKFAAFAGDVTPSPLLN